MQQNNRQKTRMVRLAASPIQRREKILTEQHEYDCSLFGARVLITLEPAPIEIVPSRGVRIR